MKRAITIMLAASMLFGCATTGNNRNDQRDVVENTRGWCFLAPAYCDIILVVGGAAAIYVATKNSKKKDEQTTQPVQPTPTTPVADSRNRLIIDTDMSAQGDPDDIQAYLAQASDLERWNVRGVVSSVAVGFDNAVPFVESIMRRLNTEVSPSYIQYPVTSDPEFYRREIRSARSEGRPLEIHIWGPITTLYQAVSTLEDRANNLSNVTVYWVASSNRTATREYLQAWDGIKNIIPQFAAFYRDERAFRGIYRGGDRNKVEAINQAMRSSRVGRIYSDHPITQAGLVNGWKGGDMPLYFYSINNTFRDEVFRRGPYGGFVADTAASESRLASDAFRDEALRIIEQNANRY